VCVCVCVCVCGACREVVCGVISGVIKEVLFPSADAPVECGYIFSLRVHPDYRYAMACTSSPCSNPSISHRVVVEQEVRSCHDSFVIVGRMVGRTGRYVLLPRFPCILFPLHEARTLPI